MSPPSRGAHPPPHWADSTPAQRVDVLPTVAPCAQTPQRPRHNTAFRAAFLGHIGTAWARASRTKTAPSVRISATELPDFEFFTPSRSVGSALVIDIDRPEAVLEIFEVIPAEIWPSWIVETRKGAQAGWMIDPVDLRPTARERPVAYARAVGAALRAALTGDQAVDPLTPVRVRNPVYTRAELRAPRAPAVYGLKELHRGLRTANLWASAPGFTSRSARQVATVATVAGIDTGNRNQTIFDVARHAAYRGEDFEAVAWRTNEAAPEPLKAVEVRGIIGSIARYMANPGGHRSMVSMPSQMRELLSEMGRRGGLANTAAQRAARALGPRASSAIRRAQADTKARQAQKMRAQGLSRAVIGRRLAASPATVSRWLRRHTVHRCRISLVEHQVIRRRPGGRSLWSGGGWGSSRGSSPGVLGGSVCRFEVPPEEPESST